MAIIFTADVFCDGDHCLLWTHGATSTNVPTKTEARDGAKRDRFVHHHGKDYCPDCWKAKKGTPPHGR